jgi:uncharacterized protein DUF2442
MQRTSDKHGGDTSQVEVTNVSPFGFWLLLGGEELFLSFEHFPWFRDATIAQIGHVERPSPDHLHWHDLDVDVAVASIKDPQKFPLMSRAAPTD